MKSRILNIDEAPYQEWSHGERYRARISWIGQQLDSRKLGFNVASVPPGKCVFPFHAHRGHEELFFILEGEGSIRIGEKVHSIRQGDFISLPPGRASAHQIINDSKAALRYLAVSTMESPEVVEYPESGKLGVFAGKPPGKAPSDDSLRHFARTGDGVGYWDGED
ncbi:MAG: cupin domain-containing protein [Acidobacteriota bacterium]